MAYIDNKLQAVITFQRINTGRNIFCVVKAINSIDVTNHAIPEVLKDIEKTITNKKAVEIIISVKKEKQHLFEKLWYFEPEHNLNLKEQLTYVEAGKGEVVMHRMLRNYVDDKIYPLDFFEEQLESESGLA